MSAVLAGEGADLWALWEGGRWAVVPTNLMVRRNGSAVMGAGLARQAADRFPELSREYGRALRARKAFMVVPRRRVVLAPTKKHWRDPSSIDLVRAVAGEVAAFASAQGAALAVPALGCGLGGLDWAVVRPILEEAFAGVDAVVLPPGAPGG